MMGMRSLGRVPIFYQKKSEDEKDNLWFCRSHFDHWSCGL